jgi:hypothetical protein
MLCCAAQTVVSLDTPQPTTFAAPRSEPHQIAWHARVPRLAGSRIGSNAKARAPPSAA